VSDRKVFRRFVSPVTSEIYLSNASSGGYGRQSIMKKVSLPVGETRRDFIMKTALLSSATVVSGGGTLSALGADRSAPPIALFSKVYQTLKLNFDDAAAVTAEVGLDGIDPPVRPDGEVLPERVEQDLPKYAEALRKHKAQLLLLTTAITSPSSPNAEAILRTAKKLGVQFYRLGFTERQNDIPIEKQLNEVKAGLKDLVALNKEIGITAIYQNHSPSGRSYVGGNLNDLAVLVKDFNPEQIGVAFDIGHALVVHGKDWRPHFDKIKSHLKVAYVKDVKIGGRWVHFGQGDIGATGYFKVLKEMNYHAPISMHIEFDWTDKGKTKTREALVAALKESANVLRKWLAEA
jgi:sugar phosphate isomerase/epimerase